jgi:hypothetical protein
MALYSSDTLPTHIEYHSTDLYDTYTMYNLEGIHQDVLNDTRTSYYLHNYWVFGLNGLPGLVVAASQVPMSEYWAPIVEPGGVVEPITKMQRSYLYLVKGAVHHFKYK